MKNVKKISSFLFPEMCQLEVTKLLKKQNRALRNA